MSEDTPDLRRLDRVEAYRELAVVVERTLEGIADPVTAMATIAALVHHGFSHLWTGFYCVADGERVLRVGPYQGALGCLEIAFGRGVCGTAAAEGRPLIVADVDAFPGHIRCDARARSEIVLPVHDRDGRLIAVFDVDSAEPGTFDERDQRGLETVLAWFHRSTTRREPELLRRSRELLIESQQLANVGSFEWDIVSGVSIWSDQLCRIFGLPPGSEGGREPYESRIHRDDHARVTAAWEALLANEVQRIDLEHRVVRSDGEERVVHIRARADRGDEGQALRVIGMFQDLTESRRLMSQLAIGDRMSSLGRLAAGVAHEINNPLTFVLSNLEIMLRRGPDLLERVKAVVSGAELDALTEQLDLMREARQGIERVAAIVRDMKGLARVPGDSRVVFDLSRAVDFAAQIAGNELRHRARLERVDRPAPSIFANEGRVGQLVLNLLMNAIEALPESGSQLIRIETGVAPDGRVLLEISDTGRGIPPDVAARVFDPFFTTRRIGEGMGLGLAICHGIVTELGGEIGFTTEVGRGTVFRVRFPPAPELAAVAAPTPPPVVAAPSHRPTLLVVDDEPAVVRALSRLLRRDYEITTVAEGLRALELLEGDACFDLILCDLMMPDMTGIELYERLETKRPERAARFLFVTGGAFSSRASAFLERMNGRWLDKPFDHATLNARLSALYAAVGPSAPSP